MKSATRGPDPGKRTNADLVRGREAYARQEWRDAFDALTAAERTAPLADEDLDRLAWAAALAGHPSVHFASLERLHDIRVAAGEPCAAARAAFWLGMRLMVAGEVGRATGWLGRAERLIEGQGECVERGYLLVPRGFAALFRHHAATEACEIGQKAAAIGDRAGDLNLSSLARLLQGQALTALGDQERGLALLDEAMLAATRGDVSPVVTGIVYCGTVGCCQKFYAIDRAREWTAALDAWCRAQPQLVAFTGMCRVHRSEVMQLQGAWQQAFEEVRGVVERRGEAVDPDGIASAWYQQGEILRLRGELEAAETAYRNASQHGREPQPGLALLRLASGQADAAAAAIRQVVTSAPDTHARLRYLPAAVEILLAANDLDGADEAACDMEKVAAGARNEVLHALACHARGSVRHARGDARGALEPLRRAFAIWQQVGAPYLTARLRAEIATVLHALGDEEGADLERDAARTVFRELGATRELERMERPPGGRGDHPFGLTARELEVLRLVASGRTNRAISEQLYLSEKTIDRHVSNIFGKIDVSTRAAATAFAYQHKLV